MNTVILDPAELLVDRLAAKDRMRLQHTRGAELGQFGADARIPIAIKTDEVCIIVAGWPSTHSVHVPTFGHTLSVTRKIVEWYRVRRADVSTVF